MLRSIICISVPLFVILCCIRYSRGEKGDQKNKQCYVCRSHADGQYYPHCPKDGNVNTQITWKENCTGHCFTRTDDLEDKLVYRGCSDSQWGLPDPLPPDGCYTYYLEVWCICNKNLCNSDAIGEGEVEFDAHIPIEKDGDNANVTGLLTSPCLFLMISALGIKYILSSLQQE